MSIAPIGAHASPIAAANPAAIGRAAAPAGDSTFAQLIGDMLNDTNAQQVNADKALEQLVSGETDNVHDVVLAMAKADMSFRLVLEIRNQLIESYQEIMRMQV